MSNSHGSLPVADNYFMKQVMETSAEEMIIELDRIGNIEDLFEREKLILKMDEYIIDWIERYRGLFNNNKMPKDSIDKINNLIKKCKEIKKNFLKQQEVLSPEDKKIIDDKWEKEGELKQSESSPAPAPAPAPAMPSNVLLNPYTPRPNYMISFPTTASPAIVNPYTPSLGGSGYRRRNKRSKKQSKKSKKSRRSKKSKKSRKTKTSRRR